MPIFWASQCINFPWDIKRDKCLKWFSNLGSLCDDIFNTTTGMISGSGSYTLGTQYNFSCKPNMIVWPANSIITTYTCLMDTMWDQNFTPCTGWRFHFTLH